MPDVTITLKTLDQSSAVVKKVKDEYKSLAPGLENAAKGVGNFMSANAALIGVLVGVGAAVGKSYQAFQKYAGEVENLARVSQTSAEEASILLQVLDDYKITAQDVTAATKAMKEKGLVPTLETLAQLSDQFLAIEDPAKRLQFANDNLGRSYEKYLKVLEAGGDTLRDSAGDVTQSLILTDEQIKKADQARLAMDELSDAWEGFKVSVGSAVGAQIVAIDQAERMREQFKALGLQEELATNRLDQGATPALDRFTKQMERGAAMTEFYKKQFPELAEEMENTEDAQNSLAESGNQFMSVLQSVSSETESYNEKNQELLDKLAELTAEQANTATWTSKYKDLSTEIDSTKDAISALDEEHAKTSQKIIFDLISQQAAADGFKNISVEALAAVGEEWGVLAEGSAAATKAALQQAADWEAALTGGPMLSLKQIVTKIRDLRREAETPIDQYINMIYTASGGAMGGTGVTGNECFTGDTLVTLGDGSTKPIRDIRKGDAVLSYNTDTKQQLITIVVETFEHVEHNNRRLLLINNHLRVTEEHALWNGKEWKHARFYDIGDLLMNVDGSYQTVTSIAEIPKNENTYNLHVNHEVHNYFAGGVLVHNAEKWTGGQLSGKEWTLVGDRKGGGFIRGASELISPDGYVVDSATSEKLIKMGLVDYQSMAFGSEDGGGGYTNPNPNPIPYTPPFGSGAGGYYSGNSSNGEGNTPAAVALDAVVADVQEQTQNAVVAIQMQTEAMASRIERSQKESRLVLERIAGILMNDHPTAVGKVVGYEIARAS